ncbi:MAG TPA: 4'-phosphopantetheinyl transferase superfamily protein [Acidimicrobiales bacterium]|nr:4'-phosphopantetheinyl transferase superfamily protein [Acidimicrobiales bacterium]
MTVVVWVARPPGLDAEPARTLPDDLLDDDERARMARFRRPLDGARFAAGRRLTRAALAHHTGQPPGLLRFDRRCRWCGGPHGKPRLRAPAGAAPDFSLTTCEGLVALAVSTAQPSMTVGVDMEPAQRSVGVDLLARCVLAPSERARLDTAVQGERDWSFLQLWTAKEAFAKAVGKGLALPLSACQVNLRRGALALTDVPAPFGPASAWSVVPVVVPGFLGAVAVDARDAAVEVREAPDGWT